MAPSPCSYLAVAKVVQCAGHTGISSTNRHAFQDGSNSSLNSYQCMKLYDNSNTGLAPVVLVDFMEAF